MFMHKALVELKEKHAEEQRVGRIRSDADRLEIKCLKCDLKVAQEGNSAELSLLKRENALTVEEKLNALRKDLKLKLLT